MTGVFLRKAPALRGAFSSSSVSARAFAAAAVSVALCAASPPPSNATDLKSWTEPTPGFALPAASGPLTRLEAYRGRVVLVHFFATWCEPCREELPALQRLVDRAAPQSLAVVAISVAEVEPRVRRFLEANPVSFPVLLDQDRTVARGWNISALPSTVILDSRLEPRLAVEADFAWDQIEPAALIETLRSAQTSLRHSTNHQGE